MGRVPSSYPRCVRRPTALLCFYPMPFRSVTSVSLGSVRFGLLVSRSSSMSRALSLLHPYLLPPPSPRVGWCGVLGSVSLLGPSPCRADRFAVIPVRSFLHQHPRKGVERPHATFLLVHFHSPLGAPTGSALSGSCLVYTLIKNLLGRESGG